MAFKGPKIVLSADQFSKNLMAKPPKHHFFSLSKTQFSLFFIHEMIHISQDLVQGLILGSFHGPYKVKYPQRQTQIAVTLHYKVYKMRLKNVKFASKPRLILTIYRLKE